MFKALGRALNTAARIDERISDELPSTDETANPKYCAADLLAQAVEKQLKAR